MAINIKNILNILVTHFENETASVVSEEEQRIADNLIDTLLAYSKNEVEELEYLDVEEGFFFFFRIFEILIVKNIFFCSR